MCVAVAPVTECDESRTVLRVHAIVPAAGRGSRLGEDKALVDLNGRSAISRLVGALVGGGIHHVVVVRDRGGEPLPDMPGVRVVEIDRDEELGMIETVRAGLRVVPSDEPFVVLPVDHALVSSGTVEAVARRLVELHNDPDRATSVVLPRSFDRVGHPAGFVAAAGEAIRNARTLRDVVRSQPVDVVDVEDQWSLADLDTPEQLRQARAMLTERAAPGVLAQMRRHRSCRDYLDQPVEHETVRRLVDVARHCSTSSFSQLCSIVAVHDPEKRARLAELCDGQKHVAQAPVFIAVCADFHRIARCCEIHGREPRTAHHEGMLQAVVDASLVAQNLQLAAESEGLAGCMIGAARREPLAIARLLGLPPRSFVVFGLVLGWPRGPRVPHGRMPLEAVFHEETYSDENLSAHLDLADEGMREWASALNSVGGYGGRAVNTEKGFADRMAQLWGTERSVKGREALAEHLVRLGLLPGG